MSSPHPSRQDVPATVPSAFGPVALGHALATRPRKWLLAIIVLAGLLTAMAVAAGSPAAARTFAAISAPTQSVMSVGVPLFGVLLICDLWRSRRQTSIAPILLAAAGLAAAVAAFGVLVCAVTTALVPSATTSRWSGAATIVLGSVLVQVVAALVGTGMGLLIRRPVAAGLGTIVLPLGLWFLLGAIDSLSAALAWLTPYGSVQNLLAGQMDAIGWAQWLVVLVLWGIGPNALGVLLWRRWRRA